MRAGERSCQVEIWGPGPNPDGEPVAPLVIVKSVWARLIPNRSARETFEDGERLARVGYMARLDYLDGQGITAEMIVKFDGLTFGIVGVMIDFATRKTVDLELSEQPLGA